MQWHYLMVYFCCRYPIQLECRSAMLILLCMTVQVLTHSLSTLLLDVQRGMQHATHKEEIRKSQATLRKRLRCGLMAAAAGFMGALEFALSDDFSSDENALLGGISIDAAHVINTSAFILVIVFLYFATHTESVSSEGKRDDQGQLAVEYDEQQDLQELQRLKEGVAVLEARCRQRATAPPR